MKKQTNFLIKGLPNGVELYDYYLKFNTDFRNWISYEELMINKELSNEEIVIKTLELCFEDGIDVLDEIDLETAFNQILWFFTVGTYEEKPEDSEDNVVNKKSKIIYSYSHDWQYIYLSLIHI